MAQATVRDALRAVESGRAQAAATSWAVIAARDSNNRRAALAVASLDRLTYNYSSAVQRYNRLIAAATARPDAYGLYARLGLAKALLTQGASGDAERAFDRSRSEAHELHAPSGEAEAMLGLAAIRARTAGSVGAAALLDSALRIVPEPDLELRASITCQRATVWSRLSRRDAYDAALAGAAMARRAKSLRVEAGCLHGAAQDLARRGLMDRAGILLRRVIDLQRRSNDHVGEAATLQWRGYLLRTLGNFGPARRELLLAVGESERSHHESARAWATLGLAQISLVFRDRESASRLVAQAATLLDGMHDQWGLAIVRQVRGELALQSGDTAAAREIYSSEVRRAEAAGVASSTDEARVQLANLALLQDDWPAAEHELAAMRAEHKRAGETGWEAGLDELDARVLLQRGAVAQAEQALRQHLLKLDPSQRELRYETRSLIAVALARRGDLAAAEREMVAADDEMDRFRSSLGERELRVRAFQSPFPFGRVASDGTEVIAALATHGRAQAALALAERRRARELVDALGRADEFRADDSTTDSSGIRARTRRAGSIRAPARDAASDLRATLPDSQTALLEYVVGNGHSPATLLVVTRDTVRGYRVPPIDSLGSKVERFSAFIASGESPRALGRALATALLDAAVTNLPTAVTRLVIVPDGVLHELPFDALVMADGRYVIQRFAVSLAPAGAVAATLWARPSSPARVSVLALGDPVSPANPRRRAMDGAAIVADTAGRLPRLIASGEEARLVGSFAGDAEVRLRERASASYIKHAALDRYRVLHFATHALVDGSAVTRTTLVLAPGGGEDGFVGVSDIAALRLDADLVVLSACSTAGGVAVAGEGVEGLTSAFLEAGARAVVATRWSIGDRSTLPLIDAFYRALAAGQPAGTALRVAKLSRMAAGAPPRDWAVFTLVGNPLVSVRFRSAPSVVRRR